MRSNTAIVILNWNGSELLKRFLPSILKNSAEAQVYVIDNGSTDNSIETLHSDFKEIGRAHV